MTLSIISLFARRLAAVAFFCFSFAICLYAKVYEKTLYSDDRDKVTIKYQIEESDGRFTIVFGNPAKYLSIEHSRKYEFQRVKVVCFDKGGGYSDDRFTSDVSTDVMMVKTDEIKYDWSESGYVWIDNQSTLNLTLLADESTLSIPIYLAYYEKPHRYFIFAKCHNLDITFSKKQKSNGKDGGKGLDKVTRTITTTEEVELDTEISPGQEAMFLVDKVRELLGQNSGASLPEGLDYYVNKLRDLELTIPDKDITGKISNVLKEVEDKQKEVSQLADKISDDVEIEKRHRMQEGQARQELAYIKEQLDKIDDLSDSDVAELKSSVAQLSKQKYGIANFNKELADDIQSTVDSFNEKHKQIEESKKRRNIWMILGGIVMAIVMFVGNKQYQNYRNRKMSESFAAQQEKMARKAQMEAERRARNLVQGKIRRAQNKTRQKVKDTIREGVNKGVSNVTNGKSNKCYKI